MISERAEFDERYFPGLKHTPLTPQPFEPPPDVPFNPVPDLGGEEESNTNPIQESNAPLQAPPEIAPAPQEPPPDAPATPPAKPIKLEPATPFPIILHHQKCLLPSHLRFNALDASYGLQLNGGRLGTQLLQF